MYTLLNHLGWLNCVCIGLVALIGGALLRWAYVSRNRDSRKTQIAAAMWAFYNDPHRLLDSPAGTGSTEPSRPAGFPTLGDRSEIPVDTVAGFAKAWELNQCLSGRHRSQLVTIPADLPGGQLTHH